jgi:hypothetical protein
MNFKKVIPFILCSLLAAAAFPQKIMLTANHTDAKFTLLNDYDDSDLMELGTGTVEFKLEKNSKNREKSPNPGTSQRSQVGQRRAASRCE